MGKESGENALWATPAPWSTKEDLEWLVLLKGGNLKAREVELARCKQNPWHFMTSWLQTEDTQNKEAPFQLFPNKLHLKVVTDFWMRERFLLVPKSRQLSMTWCVSALYLWESLFFPSRLTFFQSKREMDADENLERVVTMHSRLPEWVKSWQPMERTYCNLSFPRSRSEIKGIPQGSDHVRGFTASGVFVDEGAFVEELDQTIAAVRPALGKNGRLTIISSSNPGIFRDLVFDLSGE